MTLPQSPPIPPGLLLLGSVPYLNVRPLLRALRKAFSRPGPWREAYPLGMQIEEAVPSILGKKAAQRHFHASLIPIFDHLLQPATGLLPGTCIAARGPVQSVLLFAKDPLEDLQQIQLDPASRTSVHLLQVLLRELNLHPHFVPLPTHHTLRAHSKDLQLPPPEARLGRLLIGDHALRLAQIHPVRLDLAQEWIRQTSLPFVFAAWSCPWPHLLLPDSPLVDLFHTAAQLLPQEIRPAATEDGPLFGFSPQQAYEYLNTALWYPLTDQELLGIETFRTKCIQHQFLPSPSTLTELSAPATVLPL